MKADAELETVDPVSLKDERKEAENEERMLLLLIAPGPGASAWVTSMRVLLIQGKSPVESSKSMNADMEWIWMDLLSRLSAVTSVSLIYL